MTSYPPCCQNNMSAVSATNSINDVGHKRLSSVEDYTIWIQLCPQEETTGVQSFKQNKFVPNCSHSSCELSSMIDTINLWIIQYVLYEFCLSKSNHSEFIWQSPLQVMISYLFKYQIVTKTSFLHSDNTVHTYTRTSLQIQVRPTTNLFVDCFGGLDAYYFLITQLEIWS